MTDCRECKYFVFCETTKQVMYKDEDCEGFVKARKLTTGEKIRQARERKGWTKRTLSTKTGLSYNTIVNYERDTNDMSLSNAAKIADALGVTLDFLAR